MSAGAADPTADPAGPPGVPVPLAFANTRIVVRGEHRDDLATGEQVRRWLVRHAAGSLALADPGPVLAELPLRASDVAAFGRLRDATRALFTAAAAGVDPPAGEVDVVNRAAAGAPSWPALVVTAEGYDVRRRWAGGRSRIVLAALAREVITVLGGPLRRDLRACHAPGCVQFFLAEDRRRLWCSTGCGNRVRAARHYLRHRSG